MPSIKEAQLLVDRLEREKGFSLDIRDKILWLVEEVGELSQAFKHNDKARMAEEAIDVLFFIVSILEKLNVNGDEIFMKKYQRNLSRVAVSSEVEQHFD